MKKFFLLSLVFVIFLNLGCKNEENNPTTPTPAGPKAPVLAEPADSAIDVLANPTLIWFTVDDAETYSLQVSLSRTFETVLFAENGIVATQKLISGLTNLKDYFWRVRAVNKNGTSDWSTIRSFTTTLGAIPQAPALVAPSDNKDSVSINPEFIWKKSLGAVSYSLQVSKSNTFTSLVVDIADIKDTFKVVSSLDSVTAYFWRIVATNRYGNQNSSPNLFYTVGAFRCGSVLIYAGKTYNTVLVGSQCWLKENLDVGVYVPSTYTGSTHSDVSNNGIIEKYCYNNNPSNCTTYGGLYDWNEAMGYVTTAGAQGICPPGWHIPTNEQLQALFTAVGGNSNALKAIGQGTGNGTGTNSSGFSALLAGFRSSNGVFSNLGNYAYFWSSSEYSTGDAHDMYLGLSDSDISFSNDGKDYGFSIRCAKD